MTRNTDAFNSPRISTRHLREHLRITAGAVSFTGQEHFDQPLTPGLKIVVILTGRTLLQIDQWPTISIAGPAVLGLLSERTMTRQQVFSPDETYRYVLVDIEPEIVRSELEIEPRGYFGESSTPGLSVKAADKTLQAVASQLLACPRVPEQNLYRLSKALELVALALEAIRPKSRAGVRGRLSAADIERLEAAREILVGSMSDPPELSVLASRVGMNVRKLTLGFRTLFGATPFAFLQEHRLQSAYRFLSSGEASVGSCAHRVGYAPTHLATLFARRFGLPPSNLIPSSNLDQDGASLNPPKLARRK